MMRDYDIRYVVAAIALAALGGLLYWQHRRHAIVSDCVELGGRWDGAASVCKMPDNRILSRPDFDRG